MPRPPSRGMCRKVSFSSIQQNGASGFMNRDRVNHDPGALNIRPPCRRTHFYFRTRNRDRDNRPLYIYLPDLQESNESALHRASNYPDLLPEMQRYCCPVEIFNFIFLGLLFIEMLQKFRIAC